MRPPPPPPRLRKSASSTDTVREFDRINSLQIQISGILTVAISTWHLLTPTEHSTPSKFLYLQYCDRHPWSRLLFSYGSSQGKQTQTTCGKGIDDAYLVVFGIILFTLIRASMMTYVFTPLGRLGGISKPKALLRFAEQAWGFTYATSSFSIGMYLFYNSEYWWDISKFYANWPETRLDPTFKVYYLMELAFWLQCILALNLEIKRKDYLQMFGHHILTSTLLIGSYCYDTTRVGHVILTLMDFADIFLPLAKMLKYTGHQTLCDSTFVLFLISWFSTRHYPLVKIILGAHRQQPIIHLASGHNITYIFVSLLSGLEVVICVWSLAILRVLWKILRGGNADDTRSDTEELSGSEDGGAITLANGESAILQPDSKKAR